MTDRSSSLVWKVRAVKAYSEAHNHLLVGEVRAKDRVCVELNCRSFHFGRMANSVKDVRAGDLGVRIIPWTYIEIVNVLPGDFDYRKAELTIDREGNILLRDRHHDHACPIATRNEPRH